MIMVVRADEADYHEDDDPSDIKAGTVRIKLEKMNSR
jgi:hypothetical protein